MKHILMIATGGTIACRQQGRGLAPSLTGEELLEFLPEIRNICRVVVENPLSIDSTDMTAEDRMKIATTVWQNYDRYDGFVVAHGTDTLSYTAAFLYHVLKNLNKPVILTGSQLPMGVEDSDAERNLLDAFRVASAGYVGVAAVLHGKVIRGNHVVKVHTTDMDAFQSIGAPLAGTVDDEGNVRLNIVPLLGGEPRFVDQVDPKIVLMKLVPDLDPSIFDFLNRYPKVIIEGFGSGGIPTRLEKVVQKLIMSGTKVYLTSQCIEGETNLHKYEVGRRAEAMGAISLGHRTTEDALAAIMCGEL